MEMAKVSDGSKIDTFVSKALSFKSKLKEVSTFNEVLKLWRETSIPYEIDSVSPYSIEYKDIQLEIYKRLSGDGYTVNNELTSGKLTNEQFELGYPWTSKNLGVVSGHFGKVAQALGAIGGFQSNKEVLEIVEFGSGWGELAIPLAKSGQKVTCVDIDAGLIARLKRIADREGYVVSTINCDFVDAAKSITSRGFDCAVFQSSFHHCLDFSELLATIKKGVLNENGVIFFFAEPIIKNYAFPWGLRYDGESLWAIMCNSWLELGFDYNFFSELLLKNGFFLSTVSGMGSLIGDGYMATQSERGISFHNWALPLPHAETWHIDGRPEAASFSKRNSILPGLKGTALKHKRYKLIIHNYAPHMMPFKVTAGEVSLQVDLPSGVAGAPYTLEFIANCEVVLFEVPTFVPDRVVGNGDVRELGFAITSVMAD